MKQHRKKEVKEKQLHPLDRFLYLSKFSKELTKLDLVSILNFCSLGVSDEEKLKWIRQFLNNPSFSNKDDYILQKGCVAYLVMKGYEIEQFNVDDFIKQLKQKDSKPNIKKEFSEKKEWTEEERERFNETKQQRELILFLENVDKVIDAITQNCRYALDEKKNSYSQQWIDALENDESISRLKKELSLRLNSPLSDAAEQYKYLSTVQVKKILSFLDSFHQSLPIKKEPTPTKERKKTSSLSLQLKRFNVCKVFQGITAISSNKIIGSRSLLIFNIKKHVLMLIKAKRGMTLDIYRTAIINFDPEKTKTIKLPWVSDKEGMNLLQACILGKLKEIEERLDSIPSIPSTFSGRCSDQMIALAYF